MPYLGNEPAVAYTSTTKDSFSGDASTTDFTMSKSANVNAVRVVVENVVQNPTVAYTCSGTTLSFTSAPPTGTNNIYVVHLGPPAATVAPPTTINNATTFTGGVTFKNGSPEDTDGGRESILTFKGVQSGEEESTLAQIQAAHDGSSDDEKGLISFKTNDGNDSNSPTERWRITSDGHFKAMVNGYGIDFSATEGSDATGSVLDDYEKGTFSVGVKDAVSGNAATLSGSTGRYTKIGRIVNISFALQISSLSGMTGTNGVNITGLPYTVNSQSHGGGEPHAQILSFISPLSSGDYSGSIITRPNNNTTSCELKYTQSGSQTSQGATSLLVNNIASNTYMCGSATYETT